MGIVNGSQRLGKLQMARKRKEEVSGSFHYLVRTDGNDNAPRVVPFTEDEFGDLYRAIDGRPPLDLKDKDAVERLRQRGEAPLEKVTLANTRTIRGTFRSAYWGHSYENTEKGTIPANSTSLRPFHFMLYLSDSGKIYMGCQYLGQFGGYQALRETILNLLPNRKRIRSHSFRLGAGYYRDAKPKEVRVNVASRPTSITGRGAGVGKMMIALSAEKRDDTLSDNVKNRLFPLFGGKQQDMRKAVADLFKQTDIVDFNDEDIQDCKIMAEMNGKTRVIHVFEAGHQASKFPLNVQVDRQHGHPSQSETCSALAVVLKDHVLSVTENG
ncbi:hypothetical protein PZ895_00425 [Mesorhizobium sp. YIM 152430]|uniref:hypothetical protein n=1 Tax=Mesorhizobium sp. YIM 152430 TaxID=3031761 RepID=UPI0023DC6EEB|nr:hypothetical protein [Mesorhizobium sp. YIM 152430]MDF1598241.1 hypothetical protein [Mesorhizobium sp. YIM 152430]